MRLVIKSENKRVPGITLRAPDEALERRMGTGQPGNTRSILFSCDPSERLPNVVPVEVSHLGRARDGRAGR